MNLSFKSKYDQMREGDPTSNENSSSVADNNYTYGSNVRNVCFVPKTGKMTFLNYSYLVSAEYNGEQNTITLGFTSHTVTLTGIHLEKMFLEFMQQLPRLIEAKDERYNSLEEIEKPIVNKIFLQHNTAT